MVTNIISTSSVDLSTSGARRRDAEGLRSRSLRHNRKNTKQETSSVIDRIINDISVIDMNSYMILSLSVYIKEILLTLSSLVVLI